MIAHPLPGPPPKWTVVCLCAEWCDTCHAYRALFEARAAKSADAVHLWVDVEDESDALGDLDIETFPTLLVLQDDRPRFFGPVLPQPEVIDALLRTLNAADEHPLCIAAENIAAVRWLAEQAARTHGRRR